MTGIRVIISTFMGLLMLFGCSAGFLSSGVGSRAMSSWFQPTDVPENPALLGAWSTQTKVLTVGMNSMNFSREGYMANGGESNINSLESDDVKACFEPALREDADLIRTAEEDFGDCQVVERNSDGELVSARMQCTKGNQSLEVTLDGHLGESEGRIAMSVTSREPKPTGATETMTLRLMQTWTRTGDCA